MKFSLGVYIGLSYIYVTYQMGVMYNYIVWWVFLLKNDEKWT